MQLDDITLPDDLLWINEFDWNPVEQNIERSLTGALVVQESELKQGRSIILSGNGEAGWVSRLIIMDLFALVRMANKIMRLTLSDGREFSVVFDRSNGSPIEANQVLPEADPNIEHFYYLSLKLLIIG